MTPVAHVRGLNPLLYGGNRIARSARSLTADQLTRLTKDARLTWRPSADRQFDQLCQVILAGRRTWREAIVVERKPLDIDRHHATVDFERYRERRAGLSSLRSTMHSNRPAASRRCGHIRGLIDDAGQDADNGASRSQ